MSKRTKSWIRRSVGGCVALLVVAFLVDCLAGPNFHVVRAGVLYRSAQPTANDLRRYHDQDGLRSVINLRGVWEGESWFENEKRASSELGLTHYDVDLYTHRLAPLPELRKLVRAMDECSKPALIHCRRGADRTSLAAAIYRLLYEGRSLDEAMAEYRLEYLHTGWAVGAHLPHMFDCYRDWLKLKNRDHSPDAFRAWLADERVIGCFGARIELEGDMPKVVVGSATPLRFRATNVSRYPWTIEKKPEAGVHLVLRNFESQSPRKLKAMARTNPGTIAPGAAVVFEVDLPPQGEPGLLQICADLQDGDNIRFDRMGEGGWRGEIRVVSAH